MILIIVVIAVAELVIANASQDGHIAIQRAAAIGFTTAREAGIDDLYSLSIWRGSGGWFVGINPRPRTFMSQSTVFIEDDGHWRVIQGIDRRLPMGKSGFGVAAPSPQHGASSEESLLERAVGIAVDHVDGVRLSKDKLSLSRQTDGWRVAIIPPDLDPRPNSVLLIRDDGTVDVLASGRSKRYDELWRVESCTDLYADGSLVSHSFYVYGDQGVPEYKVNHLRNGETWFIRLAPDGKALETRIVDASGRIRQPGGKASSVWELSLGDPEICSVRSRVEARGEPGSGLDCAKRSSWKEDRIGVSDR